LYTGQAAQASQEAISAQRSWLDGIDGEVSADRVRAHLYLVQCRAQLQHPGQGDTVADTLAAATAWAASNADPVVTIYTRLLQAECAAAVGDAETARTSFDTAFELAETTRAPNLRLEVARSFGLWLLQRGEAANAAIVAGRVAGWADRHYEAALLQLRVHHALGDTAPWRSTLANVRALAGEREIPAELLVAPTRSDAMPETPAAHSP
jgi:hypothetical protein